MQNCLEGQLSKEEIEQKFTQKREETEGGKKKDYRSKTRVLERTQCLKRVLKCITTGQQKELIHCTKNHTNNC